MTTIRLSDGSHVETNATQKEILDGISVLNPVGITNSITIRLCSGRDVVLFVAHIVKLS